jgi:hypothetical protein
MGLSLMNMLGLSWSVNFGHIACYWKYLLLNYTSPLQSRSCLSYVSDATSQLSHLNSHKLDYHQVQVSYIFYIWLHLVLYREHVRSHDFVWLLLASCIILLYNRIHMKGSKLCANRGPVWTFENFKWCAEPYFAGAVILRGMCVLLIFRRDKR